MGETFGIGCPHGPQPRLTDETIRAGTTPQALAGLRPAFADEGYAARFPEIDWCITPGNSSPLTDGASAALIMSADKASYLGLTPRARPHSFAVVGSDPLLMLTGPKSVEYCGFSTTNRPIPFHSNSSGA